MVQEFPGKVSRNSGNCKISEMRTIQLKILEIPRANLNGKKTTGKNFRKFGYTSRGCPLFWKFLKMLFHLLLEIAENSCREFGRMESAHCFQYLILINQLLVQSVFTWRHGGHTGVSKQWNGGHVGVPNQSFGSWTLFLCKLFLLFQ